MAINTHKNAYDYINKNVKISDVVKTFTYCFKEHIKPYEDYVFRCVCPFAECPSRRGDFRNIPEVLKKLNDIMNFPLRIAKENKMYYCYGCDTKGNAAVFLSRYYNLPAIQAAETYLTFEMGLEIDKNGIVIIPEDNED